ncbi:hypothetical protein P280DRAFT_197923 [Massarina eburnea CBS 473.64]|uniref:Carbohydrate esterase family 16 protein n=1 Tax=Massarina eburnea CBS 473.64 TaxID=1395130 RepID=A0A6A6RMB8_9PLEO|nr:hypothetical protein P280DRAFT_197923 [Massarina eburnea CBS 473.64]
MHLQFLTLILLSFIHPISAQPKNWPGWNGISNLFVFGDSYTATSFDINSTQPNNANPLGNPAFPGQTFSNGRNYIDFLTYTYNDSLIYSYNIAMGGASVDSFGQPSMFRPFDQQVRQFFLPNYAQNSTKAKARWRSNDTLFTSFFGINDVNASFKLGRANMSALHDTIFATYAKLVDELYQAGARNFMFFNVPPIYRAPLTTAMGNASVEANKFAVADFNLRLLNMVRSFSRQKADVAVFMMNTFTLFDGVLNDPKSRDETKEYTNTTGSCMAYSFRNYNETTFDPRCGAPQNQLFWLDTLHPTPPIHNAMAADVAALLRNNRFMDTTVADTNTSSIPSIASPQPAQSAFPVSNDAGRLLSSPMTGIQNLAVALLCLAITGVLR